MHNDKRRYDRKPEPKKFYCSRIGCNRQATNGVLCARHEDERKSLSQDQETYFSRNCIDKSREEFKEPGKKKPAPRFRKQDDDE